MWFGIANNLFGLFFLVSATLQYNDPDPIQWMTIYGLAAFACFLTPRWSRAWILNLLIAAAAIAWAIFIMKTNSFQWASWSQITKEMKASTPAIETSREALGLGIVAAWTLVLAILNRKRKLTDP